MEYSLFVTLNGWLYVIICFCTIPLHMLVSYSIIRTGAIRRRITLRILLSLSFADVFQLTFHGISGLSIVFGVKLGDTFNDIMGIPMSGLWAATLIQHVTLAINRLQVVMSKKLVREEPFKYFDTTIVISWTWGIVVSICRSIGYHNLYFDAPMLNWAARGASSTVLITVLFWCRLVALAIGLIASVIVIGVLVMNRRTLNENSGLLTTKDLRLFIQTTTVFILAIMHVGTWNLVAKPDVYLLSVLNLEWILVCGLLPYLNLAMSSDIRNSLLKVLKIDKRTTTSSKVGPVTVFNITSYNSNIKKVPLTSA